MSQSSEDAFHIGVEEEFFLVDAGSLALASDPPLELYEAVAAASGAATAYDVMELMSCQVEVRTTPCGSIEHLRQELRSNRRKIIDCVGDHGLRVLSAGSHPTSHWTGQRHSDKPRYDVFADRVRMPLRRLVTCALQVHVEVPDRDERVRASNLGRVFLPYLLGLSVSSPFWGGAYTGLKSYRPSVFEGLPRTGIPPVLADFAEYEGVVERLCASKLIEDETELWWDIRPRKRFPTIELRVSDACPSIEDAVSLSALFLCLVKAMLAGEFDGVPFDRHSRPVIGENKWQAQLRGVHGVVFDFETCEPAPFGESLERLVKWLRPYAVRLGCEAELEYCLQIAADGTCADRQVEMCLEHSGLSELATCGQYGDALAGVTEWLCDATERLDGACATPRRREAGGRSV